MIVYHFSVEDPSENFQRVRDFVDCKNCMRLPSFQKEELLLGFSEKMRLEAREKLFLNRVRCTFYVSLPEEHVIHVISDAYVVC